MIGLGLFVIVFYLFLTGYLCSREVYYLFYSIYFEFVCWGGGFLKVCVDGRMKIRDKGIFFNFSFEFYIFTSVVLVDEGCYFV